MIDKRIAYRKNFRIGSDEGDVSGREYGGPPGGGATSLGSGRDFSKGPSSTNREKAIMSRGKGPKGTTGDIRGFRDTGPDRSKVSQFSKYGKNRMAQSLNPNLRFDPRSGTMKKRFSPSMIFGGLLSLITGIPGIGLALGGLKQGLGFIGDKVQDLRGYNEDGSPRTQAEYEAAMQQKSLQNRLDNLYDRKAKGKGFSQKNIDMLEAMGLQPSTAQNVLTGRDLKGFTPSRMGIVSPEVIERFSNSIGPGGVNVPSTNIETIDVGFENPAFENELIAGLTEKQKQLLDQRKGMLDALGDQGILDTIKSEDDPNDPATLQDVRSYYGLA